MKEEYRHYAHGKLLLSGEYAIAFGAKGLSLPLKFGQSLIVHPIEQNIINWSSTHIHGTWFSCILDAQLKPITTTDSALTSRLINILTSAIQIDASVKEKLLGFAFETHLEFNPDWGWGSSSTLISNLSSYLGVDPYRLLSNTFGGSGYDIATATSQTPISYQLQSNRPEVNAADYYPVFSDHLYFIYLGKKQSSREALSNLPTPPTQVLSEITDITEKLIACKDFNEFKRLTQAHEHIISKFIQQPRIQEHAFPDFNGSIKSLGAWGGDFILVATEVTKADIKRYFSNKGLNTLFAFKQIVLTP